MSDVDCTCDSCGHEFTATPEGGHRLLCGDATSEGDVAKLLDGAEPFIMVTDPPYGVNYDPAWRNEVVQSNRRTGKIVNDDSAEWSAAYSLFEGCVAYTWHAHHGAGDLYRDLVAAGFSVRAQIIWCKPKLVPGRGHYHWQHEPCWYAARDGASAKWCGDRNQTTTWSIQHLCDRASEGSDEWSDHAAQKPVECMARPIRNHGDKDDHVYDPFVGSGTTIIAAEQLGRRCYAMEIEPKYVDVSVARWEKFTGRTAVKET